MAFISRITGNYRNWTSNFLSISKSSKNSHQFHLNFTAKYNFVITISGTSQSFDLLLIMLNPFLVSFKIRIHLNNGWEESIPRCDWVNSTLIQLSTTIPTRIGISDPKITCFSILGKYQVKHFFLKHWTIETRTICWYTRTRTKLTNYKLRHIITVVIKIN